MTKHDINITLFMPSLEGGGAEHIFVVLANAMVEQYQSVTMLLANATGPFLRQLDPRVQVVNLRQNRILFAFLSLIKYLRKNRPNILIAGMEHTNLTVILANLLTGKRAKVIATIHCVTTLKLLPQKTMKSKIIFKCIRHFYPRADKVITVSRGVAEDISKFIDLDDNKLQVIYNPINFKRLSTLSESSVNYKWFADDNKVPVILAVGRLVEVKNTALLIKAFDEVRKKRDVRLLIIGEGEEHTALGALIEERGINDLVDMPGFIENPYPYMAKCKLFVLTSLHEAFSIALLEALYLSPQVISTDCFCGPREILAGGRYGTLVPVDDVEALANAIVSGLDNPKSVAGVNDYLHTKFDCDRIVQQYNNVILELLND